MNINQSLLYLLLLLFGCSSEESEPEPIEVTSELEVSLMLNQTITIDSLTREYHLYIPKDYINAPIVFLFHGNSGNFNEMLGLDENGSEMPDSSYPFTPWLSVAERENIILAVPNGYNDGSNQGWNDCRGDAAGNSKEDDVLLTSSIIDFMGETYMADINRVYTTGFSNGGHMSIRLAQELPEKISAFAAVAAANSLSSTCRETKEPVSALFMCGTDDPITPYDGGEIAEGTGEDRGSIYSVEESVDYWVQRNKTSSTATETFLPDSFRDDNCTIVKYEYADGENNTEVVLYKVIGGGHAEPSTSQRYGFPQVPLFVGEQNGDIEMAETVWDFFKEKSK